MLGIGLGELVILLVIVGALVGGVMLLARLLRGPREPGA